jgi:Nuclease-related domain
LFAKERAKPIRIEQNEALIRNLVDSHTKIPLIEQDLKKRRAGFNGEKSVDYHLSFLNSKKYMIFNDLKIPLTPHHFQIDSLLFTPFYTLILEIKNISGTLTIDSEFNQLTKNYNGVVTGFSDPITQANRQKLFLQRFFYDHHLVLPPIKFLVVISNPSTILKMAPGQKLLSPYDKIIHAQNLISEISKLNTLYTEEKATKKDLKRIKKVLLNKNDTGFTSVLDTYGINETEILKGVKCEKCSGKMERFFGCWNCTKCNFTSKTAHVRTIEDYFLLFKPSVTNRELRAFLDIKSPKTANQLLNSLNLKVTGSSKGTTYHKEFL